MRAFALLSLLLTACSACGALPHGFRDPGPADVIRAEDARTVELTGTVAGGGYYCSGVLVSDHQVVTAAHCADEDAIIMAERSDGTRAFFSVEVIVPGLDMVRLETIPGTFGDPPARVNVVAPELGQRVCIAAAVPRHDHKCGEVQRVVSGGFYHSAITEHGNSGSAIYDDLGHLVGIVSTLYTAANGQIIGGGAGSLEGYEWLVRP